MMNKKKAEQVEAHEVQVRQAIDKQCAQNQQRTIHQDSPYQSVHADTGDTFVFILFSRKPDKQHGQGQENDDELVRPTIILGDTEKLPIREAIEQSQSRGTSRFEKISIAEQVADTQQQEWDKQTPTNLSKDHWK